MADMKKVYDDLIIINLYYVNGNSKSIIFHWMIAGKNYEVVLRFIFKHDDLVFSSFLW